MLIAHRSIALVLLLVLVLCMTPAAFSASSDEAQLKAVFVLNFAKLTEWPVDSPADSSNFVIAIFGKVPPTAFTQTLQSQLVHGGKVTIRYVETVADAKGARLVYISGTERQRLNGILRDFNQLNILTVSDISGFCEAGGMIGLVPVQKRLGFEVNLAAVRKARLSVSSQMLKLARTIYGQ